MKQLPWPDSIHDNSVTNRLALSIAFKKSGFEWVAIAIANPSKYMITLVKEQPVPIINRFITEYLAALVTR